MAKAKLKTRRKVGRVPMTWQHLVPMPSRQLSDDQIAIGSGGARFLCQWDGDEPRELSGKQFNRLDLSNTDFNNIRFVRCRFKESNLEGATLIAATSCDFAAHRWCRHRSATWKAAHLRMPISPKLSSTEIFHGPTLPPPALKAHRSRSCKPGRPASIAGLAELV